MKINRNTVGKIGFFHAFDGNYYWAECMRYRNGVATLVYSIPGREGYFKTYLDSETSDRFTETIPMRV
jgi:trehalose utilization protein